MQILQQRSRLLQLESLQSEDCLVLPTNVTYEVGVGDGNISLASPHAGSVFSLACNVGTEHHLYPSALIPHAGTM